MAMNRRDKLQQVGKGWIFAITFILGSVLVTSCGDGDKAAKALEAKKVEAITNYANVVHANYQDALKTAEQLRDAIKAMTDNPDATTYQAAKDAWLAAREPYGQSEAFRFYGGPIDDEDGPEGQMNAWPLDESYIDYVNGAVNGSNPADNDGTNIINSPEAFPEITATVLAGLNEAGGETNVSTGYHAIEFLLWGQDQSPDASGGDRTYKDYIVGGPVSNADRRVAYINAVAGLLVSDLQSLAEEWAPGSAFRSDFTAAENANTSLEKVLTGLGKLCKGELSGERMFVAWDFKSKEDEHSCFSDNTHRDIVANTIGIENVYYGRYISVDGTIVDGTGLDEIAETLNPALNAQMKALLAASGDAVKAIQAPFDQEILGADTAPGRVRVKTAIDAIRAQGDKFAEIVVSLGYKTS